MTRIFDDPDVFAQTALDGFARLYRRHAQRVTGGVVRAAALATLLVDRLLAERPEGWNNRAAIILNGPGGTKYEELFVLSAHVSDRLGAAGTRAADAAIGAAEATAALTPRLGRARPLAARSIGHPDAGAISLALCARTVAERIAREPVAA